MGWPPTVINNRGSSGVLRTGACVGTPGHLQSWLESWESDPRNLWEQSLLQCGPLQTGHGCLRVILLAPPFHSNRKPIPFPLGPSGHFSQAVLEWFWQPLQGLPPVPLSFSAFLYFPHIPYHIWLLEPVVTDYLKTDLVHMTILIAYSGYLEPTEWEIYPLKSIFPLHFQDQYQWICEGLLSVYLVIYQEFPSPPVLFTNFPEFKGLVHICLSPSRIHLTKWLWSHFPLAVL